MGWKFRESSNFAKIPGHVHGLPGDAGQESRTAARFSRRMLCLGMLARSVEGKEPPLSRRLPKFRKPPSFKTTPPTPFFNSAYSAHLAFPMN